MKYIKTHKALLFFCATILLIVPEILKVYFIMPMPGSQQQNNVELAYSIHKFIWVSRAIGGVLLAVCFLQILREGSKWLKIASVLMVLIVTGLLYMTNFVMPADKMFYQPETKTLLNVAENKIDDERTVIGVDVNGVARAYPIFIIGYHHQVLDTLAGQAIMVTYCTVCRTGRVYKPEVKGKPEVFRLVGMDQFNAMFEDATTKSWWRQATGECCAGPLKGNRLFEIPSKQMSLRAWKKIYPETQIMQPDAKFGKQYAGLRGYDDGSSRSFLTGTDTSSFHAKSWVVGVVASQGKKMYDWNELKQKRVIQDTINTGAVVLLMNEDNQSFYVFENIAFNNTPLNFTPIDSNHQFTDLNTHSLWNLKGECTAGALSGSTLKSVPAYQEFYHSFRTFHPSAAVYK